MKRARLDVSLQRGSQKDPAKMGSMFSAVYLRFGHVWTGKILPHGN